ncbi:MAG: chemotaxis protein CheW [Prochloraceae cyanobacterium]|nr:chemotaxis protein CheW [Prochloraceae cyanobacterium]
MMLDAPFPFKKLSARSSDRELLQVIVFTIQNYFFALPVEKVLKVIICPPIESNMSNGVGVANLEAETLTVIDLNFYFLQPFLGSKTIETSNDRNDYSRRFLIKIQIKTGEAYGIIVDRAPSLADIPLTTIRPLPLSYRQESKISFVSHIAILPQPESEKEREIFLLGMEQMLAKKLVKNQTKFTPERIDVGF